MKIFEMIADGGIPAFIIVAMGLFALAIIVERVKVLYKDYGINSESFMKHIRGMVMKDQIEDAITFCANQGDKPLPHVVKAVLERSDRDDESINQGMDIAMAEVIPKLGKRLGYLAMIANVSTLVGLLGTIQGLILSFEAVSFADPSQKQELLAQGISMAMNTTALGLSVAIPVMITYAFLHARQGRLLEEVSEHSAKVVDILTTRHYAPLSMTGAFTANMKDEKKPPKAPPRAA